MCAQAGASMNDEETTAVSWQAAWQDSLKERMDPKLGLPAVHAKYPTNIDENVKKTKSPGATAAYAFEYVIDIGCVDPDHPYVGDFLGWTIQMAETMLADARRWESQWAVLRPAKHSLLTGVLALAYGMREDKEPDATLLDISRQDAIQAFDEARGKTWMAPDAQAEYLRSVQFCLLGGDVSSAAQMLRGKRRFGWTQHWHDPLAAVIRNLEATDGKRVTDTDVINAFDKLFDFVRAPKYQRSKEKGETMGSPRALIRLQLATIRHKFVDGLPVAGCWRQILKSISA